MTNYTSLFQRIVSCMVIGAILLLTLALGAAVGFYILLLVCTYLVLNWVYRFYQSFKSTRVKKEEEVIVSGHVEVGDFSRGPGRIIDHIDE